MTDTFQGMISACLAGDPDDSLAVSALADVCEETGRPARAAALRVAASLLNVRRDGRGQSENWIYPARRLEPNESTFRTSALLWWPVKDVGAQTLCRLPAAVSLARAQDDFRLGIHHAKIGPEPRGELADAWARFAKVSLLACCGVLTPAEKMKLVTRERAVIHYRCLPKSWPAWSRSPPAMPWDELFRGTTLLFGGSCGRAAQAMVSIRSLLSLWAGVKATPWGDESVVADFDFDACRRKKWQMRDYHMALVDRFVSEGGVPKAHALTAEMGKRKRPEVKS